MRKSDYKKSDFLVFVSIIFLLIRTTLDPSLHQISFRRKRHRQHLSICSVGKQEPVSQVLKVSKTAAIPFQIFYNAVERLNWTIRESAPVSPVSTHYVLLLEPAKVFEIWIYLKKHIFKLVYICIETQMVLIRCWCGILQLRLFLQYYPLVVLDQPDLMIDELYDMKGIYDRDSIREILVYISYI